MEVGVEFREGDTKMSLADYKIIRISILLASIGIFLAGIKYFFS